MPGRRKAISESPTIWWINHRRKPPLGVRFARIASALLPSARKSLAHANQPQRLPDATGLKIDFGSQRQKLEGGHNVCCVCVMCHANQPNELPRKAKRKNSTLAKEEKAGDQGCCCLLLHLVCCGLRSLPVRLPVRMLRITRKLSPWHLAHRVRVYALKYVESVTRARMKYNVVHTMATTHWRIDKRHTTIILSLAEEGERAKRLVKCPLAGRLAVGCACLCALSACLCVYNFSVHIAKTSLEPRCAQNRTRGWQLECNWFAVGRWSLSSCRPSSTSGTVRFLFV